MTRPAWIPAGAWLARNNRIAYLRSLGAETCAIHGFTLPNTDPPPDMPRLCRRYAPLISRGHIDWQDAITHLYEILVEYGFGDDIDLIDPQRMLTDAVERFELAAARDIREAIAPCLARRADGREIKAAAVAANAGRLCTPDVIAVCKEEMAAVIARLREKRRG